MGKPEDNPVPEGHLGLFRERVERREAHPEEAIPRDDLEGELETRHLLRSPANRERLLRALENVERGENLVVVDPGDLDE